MKRKALIVLLAFHLTLLGCSFNGDFAYLPPIDAISFTSADEAWFITNKHKLFRLSADGSLLSPPEVPPAVDALTFMSADRGWIVDSSHNIWAFDGQRWTMSGHEYDQRRHALNVSFGDEEVGWIRTLEPLFLTQDRGATWNKVLETEPGQLTRVFAASRDTAYLYGTRGEVLQTSDRGQTWRAIKIGSSFDVISFECRHGQPNDCWAGTSDGQVVVITEKGISKKLRVPEKYEFAVTSIALSGERRALVAGYTYIRDNNPGAPYGILYETENNGETWKPIDVPPDQGFVKVAAFGSTIWLASTDSIYRSTDAGKSWTWLLVLPDHQLKRNLEFKDL
jgi:photosystem II stability/assembly factor-like uncharacterized protein